jgi:RNA polymerase sigma-70 factor (ECF subfamily)
MSVLTREFEANRPHLRAVAHRILGNLPDADDAVQETWLRWSANDDAAIDNLGGWLTTVVSRISLNVLRSRNRAEASLHDSTAAFEDRAARVPATPEEQALLADSVGVALLIVLEQLSPAERICFVLHDTFSISFDEISLILSKSPEACRQLASRARRRLRTTDDPQADPGAQRAVVDAFLAAAKNGDFASLLNLLSPDVELTCDAAAIAMGGPAPQRGSHDVAAVFSGKARAARLAMLDGAPGLVWSQGGVTRVAFDFSMVRGKIVGIAMIADTEVLEEMLIEVPRRSKED